MAGRIGVGVIGCGVISEIYLKNLSAFDNIDLLGVADLDAARASSRAGQFGVTAYPDAAALLADPAIGIVLNLTIPRAHHEIAMQAIAAGKSVYNEKPLAIERAEGQQILDAAARAGVLVGGAPDTVLGAGIQTSRELVDSGEIGRPVSATAFMLGAGPESWHPDPAFYYHRGGGPMFDMGPYYLTALVTLLGPVARVTGTARISSPQRTITSEPKFGQVVDVEVPTHVVGVLEFASGAIGTIVTSFDIQKSGHRNIEVHGTGGALQVPDPNTFDGPVRIAKGPREEWNEVEITRPYRTNSRGLGVADMANALLGRGVQRASGAIAFHVLDIMHAIHEASATGSHVTLGSAPQRPEPMPSSPVYGLLPA